MFDAVRCGVAERSEVDLLPKEVAKTPVKLLLFVKKLFTFVNVNA